MAQAQREGERGREREEEEEGRDRDAQRRTETHQDMAISKEAERRKLSAQINPTPHEFRVIFCFSYYCA